jgi:hypothetical protein
MKHETNCPALAALWLTSLKTSPLSAGFQYVSVFLIDLIKLFDNKIVYMLTVSLPFIKKIACPIYITLRIRLRGINESNRI